MYSLITAISKKSERHILKRVFTYLLSRCGVGITSASNLGLLRENQLELYTLRRYMEFISKLDSCSLPKEIRPPSLVEFSESTGQLNQDLIVLMFLDFRKNGYFVEFGATDGVRFSNTFLLESGYNWVGILAEPGRNWHSSLKTNRKCLIETKCVWSKTGENLKFNETEIGELSTLDIFSSGDMHADARSSGKKYNVETITLKDMLEKNFAPKIIDYLSIDTEGSEYHILKEFDFTKFRFEFISCEHNFTKSREQIRELLEEKGYVRILNGMSLFDDWYVHESLAASKGIY